MKKIFFLAFVVTIAFASIAQSLTESKDGVNSILLNGSAITFKVTDPSIKVDFQKNKPFNIGTTVSRNNGYLFGISAEGKNQSGIANIFSDGNLVPAGRVTGVGGFYFTNNIIEEYELKKDQLTNKSKTNQNEIESAEKEKEELNDQITKEIDLKKIDDLNNKLKAVESKIAALQQARLDVGREFSDFAREYTRQIYYKLSVFLIGGSEAKSFKRFLGYDPTNLQASFKNENFRGGFYGLGINYQYGKWIFGTTIGEVSADNQSLLAEQTFRYEKTTTVGNEVIKESKDIKAYAGSYDKVTYTSLNFDIVANVALDQVKNSKDPRNYMWINPYLRSKFSSSNLDLSPNTTNVGLGLYLFDTKSKLVGGIFAELPDVNNNIEKSKVVSDRNIRPALQKLSFGIVTRFNLETFTDPRTFDKLK